MNVEQEHRFLDRAARRQAPHAGELRTAAADAGLAVPQRFLAIVGDEHRA
jgi:hypothetical protein